MSSRLRCSRLVAATSVTVVLSCASQPDAGSGRISGPPVTVTELKRSAVPEGQASEATEVLIDDLGYEYVLVDQIVRPGERINFQHFVAMTENGFRVGPTGLTYGVIPEVPEGEIEREEHAAPDLIPVLDPNGSDTVIGFIRKQDYYHSVRPNVEAILAADGVTAVGVRTAVVENHVLTSLRFEPAQGAG